IYSGETITLTCGIEEGGGSEWEYEWRTPDYYTPPNPRGSVMTSSVRGDYSCKGRLKDGASTTEWSDAFTVKTSVTNRAVVTLQHDWPEIYSGETITLTCGIEEGGGSEWEYEWRTPDYYTPPNPRGSMMTSSVRGDYSCKGRLKDGGSTTEWSDAFTVKTSEKPTAQLSKNSVDGRVTLTCSVGSSSSSSSSSGWKYFWYKDEKTSEPLKPGDDVLLQSGSFSPSGGGVYWCRGGRGDPVYYTEYSHPVVTNRAVVTLQHDWPEIYSGETITLTCGIEEGGGSEWEYEWRTSDYYTPPHPRGSMMTSSVRGDYSCKGRLKDGASTTEWSDAFTLKTSGMSVSIFDPHRLQHFSTESLSLSCEGNSAEWRVMKADESGFMSSCSYWGQMTGSTCNTTRASSGVYWCESATQSSNAANITTHSGDVILVSSVHPVTGGHSVTLGCMLRTKDLLHNVDFYKNAKLLPNGVGGELLISAVTKSDEGFYKCRGRNSPPVLVYLFMVGVYLCVDPEEAASSSVFLVPLVVGLVSGVLLIILLLLILRCYRKSKGEIYSF
uniref:Ig-like domain-containing protein n=1 Tax=Gasterosteus aculeatus aculeatus TaxID=481459 RepID=G3Q5P1_GASAC